MVNLACQTGVAGNIKHVPRLVGLGLLSGWRPLASVNRHAGFLPHAGLTSEKPVHNEEERPLARTLWSPRLPPQSSVDGSRRLANSGLPLPDSGQRQDVRHHKDQRQRIDLNGDFHPDTSSRRLARCNSQYQDSRERTFGLSKAGGAFLFSFVNC